MARTREKLDGAARFEMRRHPHQRRAKSTVAYIKQATIEILASEGISGCGTERIAARAGISVGSLYKYFPNREAILKALYEDVSIEYAKTIGALTLKILDLPTAQGMEITIRKMLAAHQKHYLVLMKLADDAADLHLERQPMALHNLVRSNIRAYIQYRNPRLTSQEVLHRGFLIEHLVFSALQGYLSNPPRGMSTAKLARDLGQLLANMIEQ